VFAAFPEEGEIVLRMTENDPAKRPSIPEILKMPSFEAWQKSAIPEGISKEDSGDSGQKLSGHLEDSTSP